MIRLALLLLCSTATLRAQSPSHQPLPDHLPANYGIIGLRADQRSDSLFVARVYPGGPAATAGLMRGDQLIAADSFRLTSTDELSRYIQSIQPGNRTQLVIRRGGQLDSISVAVTDIGQLYSAMGTEGHRPNPSAKRHNRWRQHSDPTERTLTELAQVHELSTAFIALQDALHLETLRYGADARLDDIHFALNNPLKTGAITADLSSELTEIHSVADALRWSARHLDIALSNPVEPRRKPTISLDETYRELTAAAAEVDRAFTRLSADERDLLRTIVPSMLQHFAVNGRLDEGTDTEFERYNHALQLAKRVDIGSLLAAAFRLNDLASDWATTPQHISLPTGTARPSGVLGDLLYARSTPLGWILVGSNGPNYYARSDILFLMELGGNDVYVDTGPPALVPPVSLYLDYGGNDHYLQQTGTGIGSVTLRIDSSGDDIYKARHMAQGSAFCGVGILVDLEGNDFYQGGPAVQGSAFFGSGLLIDREGNDFYSISHIGQGFGGMRGMGLLADTKGDDFYLADFQAHSAYGLEGQFAGWAQGVGCGFRGQGSGGIGVLYDRSGNDRYQAGEFSQGLGYFFGLGMLFDEGGDDLYRGRRYAQGSAAHQAIGLLFDAAGDDTYRASTAAGQGASWDAAIGYLRDVKGNDIYRGATLAQGAAAMNGWALLIDEGGRDIYSAQSGQGLGGSTIYWGGRNAQNMGGLIDLGDQPDTYTRPMRRDGHTLRDPGFGIFLDR